MEKLQLDKMQNDIENIWKNRNELINYNVKITARALIEEIVNLLSCGKNGKWVVPMWIKQAILRKAKQ